MTSPSDIDALLEDRGEVYGPAWKITSRIMNELLPQKAVGFNEYDIRQSLYFFPWVMILNKLARLIKTPRHVDSWRDIAGYVQLVLEDLDVPKTE